MRFLFVSLDGLGVFWETTFLGLFFWGFRTGTVRLGGQNKSNWIYIYGVGRNEIQTYDIQLYRSAKVLKFKKTTPM